MSNQTFVWGLSVDVLTTCSKHGTPLRLIPIKGRRNLYNIETCRTCLQEASKVFYPTQVYGHRNSSPQQEIATCCHDPEMVCYTINGEDIVKIVCQKCGTETFPYYTLMESNPIDSAWNAWHAGKVREGVVV